MKQHNRSQNLFGHLRHNSNRPKEDEDGIDKIMVKVRKIKNRFVANEEPYVGYTPTSSSEENQESRESK